MKVQFVFFFKVLCFWISFKNETLPYADILLYSKNFRVLFTSVYLIYLGFVLFSMEKWQKNLTFFLHRRPLVLAPLNIFASWFWLSLCFPDGSAGKESACNAGDLGLIPGLGRSPGEGKGYPLQYSGLENSMDPIVNEFAKSRTQLSNFHFHWLRSPLSPLPHLIQ